jgi:hypothetical protein
MMPKPVHKPAARQKTSLMTEVQLPRGDQLTEPGYFRKLPAHRTFITDDCPAVRSKRASRVTGKVTAKDQGST